MSIRTLRKYAASINLKETMIEVVGEIIGKYIELIAMNFSLVSKLNIYEKKYGKLNEGEFDKNELEDSMATDEIKIINAMANHIPKG